PASYRDKAIELSFTRETRGAQAGFVRRLDTDAVEKRELDAVAFEGFQHIGDRRQTGKQRIGDYHDASYFPFSEIHSHLACCAPAESNAGRCHFECVVVAHRLPSGIQQFPDFQRFTQTRFPTVPLPSVNSTV